MTSNNIILFDGICILCNGFIEFVIKYDSKEVFMFSSLQSEFAKQHAPIYHNPSTKFETVYLIRNGIIYEKSTAVLMILTSLPHLFKLCYVFFLIPKFIRDFVYAHVARRRYSLFGKKDQCMIPPPNTRLRFLE